MQQEQAQRPKVQLETLTGKLDCKKNGLWGWAVYQGEDLYQHSEQLYLTKERADEALSLTLTELKSNAKG